ncbi:MAG TPA: calcium-binding EGF-like domain-containing protein [Polyangiaceae bacterium]|nr:calcium-binding EGF-like domain-containing protein [Polyangiaceae bacterium]
MCEATWGKTIDMGTGFNTLIAPVPLAQLRAMGLTIANVSQVIVQQNSCKSACVTQPDCSGHGSCIEGAQAGQVACQCAPGYTGTKCEVPPVAPTVLSPVIPGTPFACYAPSFTGTLRSSGATYSDLHYATPDFSHGVCAPLFCDALGNSVASPTDAQLNTPPPAGSTCSAFGDATCPADTTSLTNVCTTNANCATGSVCASHCVDAGCINIEHRCAKLAASCGGLPAQNNCDEFQICPQPGATGQANPAALQSELGHTTAPGPTGTIDAKTQDPLPTSYDTVADLVCAITADPSPIKPPLADVSNKPASDGSKEWGIFVTPTSDFSIAPTKRSDGIGELNMTAEGGVSAGAIVFGSQVPVIDANIQALVGECGITLSRSFPTTSSNATACTIRLTSLPARVNQSLASSLPARSRCRASRVKGA